MRVYAISLILATYITLSLCAPDTTNDNTAQRLSVRSPKYDFGLGKRRYWIESANPGAKRMPHYDFGLGRRSQPFSEEEESFVVPQQSSNLNDLNLDNWEEEIDSRDDMDLDVLNELRNAVQHKRARPYSFGLGKRRNYDFGLGKRLPNRYNFGLGKR